MKIGELWFEESPWVCPGLNKVCYDFNITGVDLNDDGMVYYIDDEPFFTEEIKDGELLKGMKMIERYLYY